MRDAIKISPCIKVISGAELDTTTFLLVNSVVNNPIVLFRIFWLQKRVMIPFIHEKCFHSANNK